MMTNPSTLMLVGPSDQAADVLLELILFTLLNFFDSS